MNATHMHSHDPHMARAISHDTFMIMVAILHPHEAGETPDVRLEMATYRAKQLLDYNGTTVAPDEPEYVISVDTEPRVEVPPTKKAGKK